MKKKIIIAGNTVFTKVIIETLHLSDNYEVICLTGFSKSNPVFDYCKESNINIIQLSKEQYKNKEAEILLKKINPDLIIVIAYGIIIPKYILEIPKFGCINIHGSLLPNLRGATPIQSSLLLGYEKTGATIQKMVYKMDEGDILAQYNVEIDLNDNFTTLREKMMNEVKNDIENFLNKYFEGSVNPIIQNNDDATYCKISDFTRDKANINWSDLSFNIHNKIRAFFPEPVAWNNIRSSENITWLEKDKILNIHTSFLTERKSILEAGTMFYEMKKLYVATSDFDLEIDKLVLEGKKEMLGRDFGNGYVKNNQLKLI
ncbi:MAG: methionyl-tRNA formyltransferase [bacterium]